MTSPKKKPRDLNLLALTIVDEATAEEIDQPTAPTATDDGKDPAAVALGRQGGLKGGKARAAKLSPEQRREIATIAAAARWKKS